MGVLLRRMHIQRQRRGDLVIARNLGETLVDKIDVSNAQFMTARDLIVQTHL